MRPSPFFIRFSITTATLVAAACCGLSQAQEIKSLRGKPSSDMILDALITSPAAEQVASEPVQEAVPARRRRGLALTSDESASGNSAVPTSAPTATQQGAPQVAPQATAPVPVPVVARPNALQRRALDLEIQFAFGSDELTNDGKDVLDQLASALKSEKLSAARNVILEGHADAKGNANFNQALSLKRAQSARAYLASRHGITASKLNALGKGSSEPADPKHPEAEINRRVRVILEM